MSYLRKLSDESIGTSSSSMTSSSDSEMDKQLDVVRVNKKGIKRKSRKCCSLESCLELPGECMHCTCDGRCGTHAPGKCGVGREGSGKNCKVPDCPRDATCRHSTRATCCHCRNLVSSQSRKTSRMKQMAYSFFLPIVDQPTQHQLLQHSCTGGASRNNYSNSIANSMDISSSATTTSSSSSSSFNINTKTTTMNTTSINSTSSSSYHLLHMIEQQALVELEPWRTRKQTCNLIAVVQKVQFNLHKFPILLHSSTLNKRVHQLEASQCTNIPIIHFEYFPGGHVAFEQACVFSYLYSSKKDQDCFVTYQNLFELYFASRELGMIHLIEETKDFFEKMLHSRSKVKHLINFFHQLLQLRQDCLTSNYHSPKLMSHMETTWTACVEALVMLYPFNHALLNEMQNWPCELFLLVTDSILAQAPSSISSNVGERVCVQTQLAQVFQSTNVVEEKSKALASILEDVMRIESNTLEKEAFFRHFTSDLEIDQTMQTCLSLPSPSTGRILAQALTQALVA